MLVLAKILVIAEQYDAGKLTEAQFELQKAQAVAEYTVLAQRQNEAMLATAAMVSSMPKTCTGYGNTVTCF